MENCYAATVNPEFGYDSRTTLELDLSFSYATCTVKPNCNKVQHGRTHEAWTIPILGTEHQQEKKN